MKKVLDFLEKNVQWIALGIGGLILLVMLAGNLPGLAQPVKVQLLNRDVGPTEIDATIKSEVADPLEKKMLEAIFVPSFRVPSYTETFNARLTKAPELAQLPDWLFRRNLALIDETYGPTDDPQRIDVAELPTLPPVVMGQIYSVQTHIKETLVPPAETPEVGPNGEPLPPPTPTMPPPVAANPANPASPALAPPTVGDVISPARDATVVRVHFKLAMDDLTRAFQQAKVPLTVQETFALKVELVRERSLSGGAWGESTVIGPLEMNTSAAPFPQEPQKPTTRDLIGQYLAWARGNQVAVLQPNFPDFLGDDPLAAVAADGLAMEIDFTNFDPGKFKGDVNKLPPDQRKKVIEARRQQAREAEARRNAAQNAPAPQAAASEMSGNALRREIYFFQAPPAGAMSPPENPAENPDEIAPTSAERITAEPPPAAPFRPADHATKSIDCWAFDDTAKPGETYRYRVRYYMKNPLFQTANVAKNTSDQSVVWIVNKDEESPWSPAVTTPPLTHVFLVAAPPANFASARFAIYHWQDGRRHKFTGSFKPGDTIGGSLNGINFVSDWTLADIRPGSGMNAKNLVMLVEPGGTIEVRDFETDKADPLFLKLEAEVQNAMQPNGEQPAQPAPEASTN